ncbi:BON domain-containing protein [Steroidobacter sp. S1-65]|uniref:BON domain-containing protein n=1 Tax=Steroidobacter gossypii TaxID=2805490 RepID=A0ABS1WYM8_9GAMM|nr:BON domain-containing protein [Steroidobacter gossypii]MBM0106032.1 BON domain-containing protein [Steroidobacter gossypii]
MRRNVVFDKGRGWQGAGHGAQVGEYRPQETSEYSDAYYGPGDEYSRRGSASGGYSREQEPLPQGDLRPGHPVGRFAPERHPDNRIYGEVRSFGELQQGRQSWADLGVNSFRGKGPKGYTRSDQRLIELICDRLTDDPHIDASEISVEVRNGEATLTGSVRDRQAKWRAEDLVESCSGVSAVHNRLRVQR